MLAIRELQKATKLMVSANKGLKTPSKQGDVLDEKQVIKFLQGTNKFCESIERALVGAQKVIASTSDWSEKKDLAYRNFASTLGLIYTIVESHIYFLTVSVPEGGQGKKLNDRVIVRLEELSERLANATDDFDLVIGYYNKEEGNSLQVAVDRLEDDNDPVIPLV